MDIHELRDRMSLLEQEVQHLEVGDHRPASIVKVVAMLARNQQAIVDVLVPGQDRLPVDRA